MHTFLTNHYETEPTYGWSVSNRLRVTIIFVMFTDPSRPMWDSYSGTRHDSSASCPIDHSQSSRHSTLYIVRTGQSSHEMNEH
jgi:hypothetical protein